MTRALILDRLQEALARLVAEGADPFELADVCLLVGAAGLCFDPRQRADMDRLAQLQTDFAAILDMAGQPAATVN